LAGSATALLFAIYCGLILLVKTHAAAMILLPAIGALRKKCAMNFGWLTSIAVDT
jgi:hypothetical protein